MNINEMARRLAMKHFRIDFEMNRVLEIEGMFLITIDEFIEDCDHVGSSQLLIDDDFNVIGHDSQNMDNPKEIVNQFRLRILTGDAPIFDQEYANFYDYITYYEFMIKGNRL